MERFDEWWTSSPKSGISPASAWSRPRCGEPRRRSDDWDWSLGESQVAKTSQVTKPTNTTPAMTNPDLE